eukprot:TRINITY_DN37375_c1_g1_i2.p1 TRINITY_DN37375_c1_g1~~TRINITY_DN37375_c1_g1_i2.p1  ORF type:complete len:338 (-),score=66.80 TRINITY_DN37375_c1_g1_i2:273-1235(-)
MTAATSSVKITEEEEEEEPVQQTSPDDEPQLTPVPIDDILKQKDEGGKLFREGSFASALECYASALASLDSSGVTGVQALRSTLASNQALCLLKLGRFREAEERASSSLAADAANAKAAYRRGLARLQLGDALGALEDLQKASRLEPQNVEIRQKCEEAKSLAEATPASASEVNVAVSAAAALGSEGGLYSEKADLNEGRLAESYSEKREWVDTISQWTEIKDISFSDDSDKNCVSVYMGLPGLDKIPSNRVCVWMTQNSLEVRVVDLNGTNWFYKAQELWSQIDPDTSTWKVRKEKLSIKLQKRASARSWDRWEKIRRI